MRALDCTILHARWAACCAVVDTVMSANYHLSTFLKAVTMKDFFKAVTTLIWTWVSAFERGVAWNRTAFSFEELNRIL